MRSLEKFDGSISVKPDDIGVMPDLGLAQENMERILNCARTFGKTVEIDMEFWTMLDAILELCGALLSGDFEFRPPDPTNTR